jgi:hypothetical protein
VRANPSKNSDENKPTELLNFFVPGGVRSYEIDYSESTNQSVIGKT